MVTTLWAGLAIGAVYAIVGIAYNIVFVATRVFNFAQAYVLMVGTFIAVELSRIGVPLIMAILLCAFAGALIGTITEIVAVRRLANTGTHNELITTLGVGVILSGIALLLWGSQPLRVNYLRETETLDVLGGRVALGELLIIGLAIGLGVTMIIGSRKSMIGIAALATSENRSAAMLRGVNVKGLATGAFALAGALVAAVAPIVATKTYATYDLGETLAVKAFIVIALGGFGSWTGAMIGGAFVGLLQITTARLIGSDWQNITVFALMLIVLIVMPHGIFSLGKKKERVV